MVCRVFSLKPFFKIMMNCDQFPSLEQASVIFASKFQPVIFFHEDAFENVGEFMGGQSVQGLVRL